MKQLRRRVAAVLALALALLSLSAVPALAGNLQPDVVLSLTPSVQSVRPGQTFTVSVFLRMPSAPSVTTQSPHLIDFVLMSIRFDPAVLTAVNFQSAAPFTTLEGPVIDNTAGTVAMDEDTPPDPADFLQMAATVATITFTAKQNDHSVSPLNWVRAQALSASSNDSAEENVVGVADGATVCVNSALGACKVMAPAVSIPHARLGSNGVKVKLSWGASDANGVSGYQLQQCVNGAPFTTMSLPSATATSMTRTLAPGGYQFRLRFTDGLGNTSDYAIGPGFEVDTNGDSINQAFLLRLYDDSSGAVTYSAGWAPKALSGAFGGRVHFATGIGDTAKFFVRRTFISQHTGVAQSQSIAWVSTEGPNRGKAEVLLDGVKVAIVNLFAPTLQTREVVWSRNVDPSRSHVVEIRVVGSPASGAKRVDVDAFVLLR